MPIAASFPILNSQITNAFNLGPAAKPDLVAQMITSAVASAVPLGYLPAAPSPIPLAPVGFSNCNSIIKNAFNMGPAANIMTTSSMMAQGISVLAPLAPPTGLPALQSQIVNAFSLGLAAQPNIVALMISQAIIQYYLAGGII